MKPFTRAIQLLERMAKEGIALDNYQAQHLVFMLWRIHDGDPSTPDYWSSVDFAAQDLLGTIAGADERKENNDVA